MKPLGTNAALSRGSYAKIHERVTSQLIFSGNRHFRWSRKPQPSQKLLKCVHRSKNSSHGFRPLSGSNKIERAAAKEITKPSHETSCLIHDYDFRPVAPGVGKIAVTVFSCARSLQVLHLSSPSRVPSEP